MSRVALVTGAGSGIGRAAAIRLSQAGLRVVLASRGADALAATAEACPGPTLAVPADVTDPAAVDRLSARAEIAGPGSRCWWSAPAPVFSARIEQTSDADWNRMLELNVTAPFPVPAPRHYRRAPPPGRPDGGHRLDRVADRRAVPSSACTAAGSPGPSGWSQAPVGRIRQHRGDGERGVPGLRRHPHDGPATGTSRRNQSAAGQAGSAPEPTTPIEQLIMPGRSLRPSRSASPTRPSPGRRSTSTKAGPSPGSDQHVRLTENDMKSGLDG